MILKDAKVKMKNQVTGLIKEYERAKGVYDHSGLEHELKSDALNTMANSLQLQSVALNNFFSLLQIEAALEQKKTDSE
jgi:hypothetical protein